MDEQALTLPTPEDGETPTPSEAEPAPAPARRSLVRRWLNRGGCLVMFVLWLGLMSLPCFFVTLLVEDEVVFHRSDLPEHDIRIFNIEEEDTRGFGLQVGDIYSGGEDEGAFCVVVETRFLLWEGEADPLTRCDCYERVGDSWSATMVGGDDTCTPIEFEFEAEESD